MAGENKGGGSENIVKQQNNIQIEEKYLLVVQDSTMILFVKVCEVSAMQNLYMICLNEGYIGLIIRHVGGM